MEITNEIKARIFASYFGCEYQIYFEGAPTRKAKIDGYHLATIMHHPSNENTERKLLLSPLSAITDDDAIEVAKIIIPLPFQKYTKGWEVARDYTVTGWPYIAVHNPKNVFKVEIDCKLVIFNLYNMEDVISCEHDMKCVEVIDFLRSRNYDCGYGSIPSLIVAGIAIEARTLTGAIAENQQSE